MAHIHPEEIEQIKIVQWVINCTDLPVIHIPNQGKRGFFNINLLRMMGFYSGACDLLFPRPTKKFGSLFIEVKSEGGKLSKKQIEFIKRMNEEGNFAIAVWGAEAAIEVIKTHFMGTKTAFREKSFS